MDWPDTAPGCPWGYKVDGGFSPRLSTVRRFLADWTERMDARYVMVSLPPDFDFPAKSITAQLIEQAVLPHCREYGLPFALMPGVKRAGESRI